MSQPWAPSDPGVLRLPSGRRVRGRSLRDPPSPELRPDLGLHLATRDPGPQAWAVRWVRWPDWWLPSDPDQARKALREAWSRAAHERVEVACRGGRGRTGTALACLAVLDGVPAADATAYVRAHYRCDAVETPWQRRYVDRFGGGLP